MRKMKKFATGGRAERGQARYDRMMKDIESDYEKAKGRKTGRAAEVAKAKYEQRMADAKDDLAKARGEDRTQTRAAEKAAERNLSTTRRYGATKTPAAAEDTGPIAKPMSASDISAAVGTVKPEAKKPAPTRVKPTRRAAAPATSTGGSRASASSDRLPVRREAARAPETRDTKDIVVEGRKPKPKQWFRGDTPGQRLGDAVGAPFRAFAKYNPLSLAASAIFDGESSKPAASTTAPKPRSAAEQTRKQHYLKRASEERAAGREGNAKYFEREASYLKRGGKVKGYAKGGSVDGCAVRGKTKAKRK